MITIQPLVTHSPEHVTCARWRHEAFLASMGLTLEESYGHLTKITTQGDDFEVALVARVEGALAGICLLVRDEIDAHHAVSPWLASLYVTPHHRRRRVARTLIAAIEDHARQRLVERLYLYTSEAEPVYASCGWIARERLSDSDGPFVLMERRLSQPS